MQPRGVLAAKLALALLANAGAPNAPALFETTEADSDPSVDGGLGQL